MCTTSNMIFILILFILYLCVSSHFYLSSLGFTVVVVVFVAVRHLRHHTVRLTKLLRIKRITYNAR